MKNSMIIYFILPEVKKVMVDELPYLFFYYYIQTSSFLAGLVLLPVVHIQNYQEKITGSWTNLLEKHE